MKSSPKLLSPKTTLILALALTLSIATLQADLPPYLQNLPTTLDTIFFKPVPLGPATIPARRPPAETRPALTTLIATQQNEPNLYALRAQEAERQLDFSAAETDWQRYTKLTSDHIALADFHHRRLEPAKELAALHAAATRPAFERAIQLIDEQLLGYPSAQTEFRAWVQAYPKETQPYLRWFDYAVAHNQLADAEQVRKQYAAAFPQDAVFPIRALAQIEAKRGAPQAALAIYDRNFQPLWPPDLIKSYFELLNQTGALRRYLESARQAIAANPDDIAATARIFYYWQQQGNLENAQRPLIEYESRKQTRNSPYTADQVWTLGQLYQAANNADRAARAYHAMYTLPGADAERALDALAQLLFASAGQPITLVTGNLSYYRDIAQVDPYPGYLNGVLSLLLNSTEPRWRYESQNQAAQAYFQRARAAELVSLFDSRFPNSTRRPALHAHLIQAYAIQGDNQGVITHGRRYLSNFPNSDFTTDVAVAMADAYARTNQTQAEFQLYDETLARLASTANALATERPGYTRILDRYLARLVSMKRIPAAVELYRRELTRNPNDPALYERFAAFLEQNRLGADVEATYRRAMAQFPDKSWSHKLAHWFLKQKQTAKLTQLTAEVAKTFEGAELETYFRQAVPSGSVAAVLYRQLNVYAHQRFPHNLTFVRNLLTAYTTRGTADPVAYEALLRANWMYADDLRARFFELLSRTKRLDAELAALPQVATPDQVNTNPAAATMLAEGEAWRAHYETAAPVFRAITASYPASTPIANRAATVYRSLATIDPKQTDTAAAIQANLIAFQPRSTQALATAGDIWADGERFDRARPLWNRIAAVAPGNAEHYLESATVFWDYYLYDDALRVISEGRQKLNAPSLHAYQAGAIYENKRQYDRALQEYASAVVTDANAAAQRRMVRLARRPSLRDNVERLTADLANRPNVRTNALELRAAVLENQGRRPELEQFLIATANRTDDADTIEWLRNQGRIGGFEQVQQRAMERRVEITTDPVDRVRHQLALAHFHEEQGRTAQAGSIIADVLTANPNSLGVVRAATDFYWRSNQQRQAIDTLSAAGGRAQPNYARAFRLEAARKATESGNFQPAQQLLGQLLKDEPFRAEYLAAMADYYARAGDDRGLRTFYQDTIKALNASNLPAAEKTERIAAMRRGLIPVFTRTGEPQAALDQYIEIINRYPEDAELTREAAAYAQKHNLDDRLLAYYAKTTTESPKDPRYHMVLARANTELERFPQAIDSYARATALRPERTDLWTAQAALAERLSRFADAEKIYTRLFELSYRNPQWMAKVAETRARQGQTDAAIAALRTAHIENRPERADNYFAVARQLNDWNMLDRAVEFATKGAEVAGADLVGDSAASSVYARIMTRARQYEAAYKRLTGNAPPEQQYLLNAPMTAIGDVVREHYTPEEKVAFAAFIEKMRRPDSRLELEIAQAAGLHDTTARILAALLRAAPNDYSLLGQLQDLQYRRGRFSELGSQLEAIWKAVPPGTENRDNLLIRAANAFHEVGDTAGLLRVIRAKKPTGLDYELSNYWCRLIGTQAQALSVVSATDAAELRDQAANCAIQWNRPKEALAAIEMRGQGMPPVWTTAHTSLAGLYFSLNTPDVQTAWSSTLGSPIIGDQLGKPVDRDRQLAGEPWFYYASRYGEYLDRTGPASPAPRSATAAAAKPTASADPVAEAPAASRDNPAPAKPAVSANSAARHDTAPAQAESPAGSATPLAATGTAAAKPATPAAAPAAPAAARPRPRADDYLSAMLEATPGNAGAYFRLAEYYRESSDMQRASERYQHALDLNPDRADARDRIAQMLWTSGDRDRATAEWREALQALHRQQESGGIGTEWWANVRDVLAHLGERDLLPTLKADADRLLKTYVRRNGTYEFELLLEGILAARRDPSQAVAWLLEIAQAAAEPGAVLEYALRSDRPWPAQKDVLYQRVIEAEQAKAAVSFGAPREAAEIAARDWRIEWTRSLLTRSLAERARAVLAALSDSDRAQTTEQVVPLELQIAARTNSVPAVLTRYAAMRDPLAADLLRNAASELRQHAQPAAARLVLEHLYSRELEAHRFDAPNFLGLAEVRLEQNRTGDAVIILRRMTMLAPGESFDTLAPAAQLLERFGKTTEAAEFYEQRVRSTPWDAAARERLASLRSDATALTAIASDRNIPYSVRADAAVAIRKVGGPQLTTGAAELDLLTSPLPLTEALSNKPYWYRARLETAASLTNTAAKIRVLQAAIAVDPSPSEPRIQLFRAAMEAKRHQFALASIWPLRTQGPSSLDADVIRAMGDAYRALNEPAQARIQYELANTRNPSPELEKLVAFMKTIEEVRALNDRRRPVVAAALEQPNVVRPRLTASGPRASATPLPIAGTPLLAAAPATASPLNRAAIGAAARSILAAGITPSAVAPTTASPLNRAAIGAAARPTLAAGIAPSTVAPTAASPINRAAIGAAARPILAGGIAPSAVAPATAPTLNRAAIGRAPRPTLATGIAPSAVAPVTASPLNRAAIRPAPRPILAAGIAPSAVAPATASPVNRAAIGAAARPTLAAGIAPSAIAPATASPLDRAASHAIPFNPPVNGGSR